MNVPIQYSSQFGTIVGPINGANRVFWLVVGVSQAIVYLNGQAQTESYDYIRLNNQITFLRADPPQAGDIITAEAYILDAPYSPTINTTVTILPTPAPTQVSTAGGTITGALNGTNKVFTITTVTANSFPILFWNGILQTAGYDYTLAGAVATFVNAPQPGDVITADIYTKST